MSVINEVRAALASQNISELIAKDDQPALQEIWLKMQDLKEEMNQAKKDAANKAAEPYIELMTKIEREYAFLLKLSA